MSKKIAIIGFFAYNTEYNGGQENKTRALADLLRGKYGEDCILTVDTLSWKKKPFKLFRSTYKSVRNSDIVIMLPAKNGVKVFSKILLFFKKNGTKLFYDVVGGWLPEVTKTNKKLRNKLLRFDGIWVETESMKKKLEDQGFKNVMVVPNFKKINPLDKKQLKTHYEKPFKVCTFSRVLKEKGIEDAIDVVKAINRRCGEIVYQLDIYGRVDSNYEDRFAEIRKKMPQFIEYKGVVPYNDTVDVIKDYFFLLFPTHYATEGIPGTIIDAYAAGVPVLSAKWKSYDDVVVDGVTGMYFRQCDNDDLERKMMTILKNPKEITNMKKHCLDEFGRYTEEYAFGLLKEQLGN